MSYRVALFSIHTSPLAPVGTQHAGGMNIYVRRLADELAREDIGVDVFTRRASPDSPEILQLDSGARVIHLSAGPATHLPKSVLPLHIPAAVAAFQDFVGRENTHYDVLHSHYWLSGLTASRVRPDTSVPFIHMFHTLSKVKELYAGFPDAHDSALRYDGERCVLRSADVVVGATREEEEYLARFYGREPRRFEVIPPAVDGDLFRPLDQGESRRRLGIGSGPVVLFVGRQDRIKGLDALIGVVAELGYRLQEAPRLLVVGAGTDRIELQRIRRNMARRGVGHAVEVRGTVPQADLPLYYSAADVLAMPSAYESFGMAALEAMACGRPVVAYRVGGLAELVQHGFTGFLADPGNITEFAALVERVLRSNRREQMGRNGTALARRFRWETVAERTMDLYEETLYRQRFVSARAAGR